jgi:hypothetical protein
MDEAELGDYIDSLFTRTLFRLETLAFYDVDSDGTDYHRFLAGEPGPTIARKQPWLDTLAAERARGLYTHRVHILTPPLTAYLQYECEWGYAYNARAGEDIRILDLSEQPEPEAIVDHDFWLIDDRRVARMHYDRGGRFAGADVAAASDVPRYRRARDAAWAAAEPFATWWARHPEHHRPVRAV